MKRVMREVLPTDCSPRKTSLNFLSGLLNESPDVAIITERYKDIVYEVTNPKQSSF
jgi:hypothetical protein